MRMSKPKRKPCNIFIPLEPEQEKQVLRNEWMANPAHTPREKWVFNRIIEFSVVNNSNMP